MGDGDKPSAAALSDLTKKPVAEPTGGSFQSLPALHRLPHPLTTLDAGQPQVDSELLHKGGICCRGVSSVPLAEIMPGMRDDQLL